ncbi:hypothetical protein AQUCO_01700599v1 [Aquilegia coerulea]|uniref:Knottin scorpion toxin-like domain-containing protein n=1 Tax=Aquilegia coerulea TaxID=218851 RepID=A0A2G5DNT0_AQUCA|nr:hypothetical protein AQUCO_01700599v1 [Aquilegia coerulea]
MAKLSFTHFFIFALIVISAVTVVPQAEAGSCKTTISKNGCDPLACRETCTHKYNGNGACTNVGLPLPVCVCEHPC